MTKREVPKCCLRLIVYLMLLRSSRYLWLILGRKWTLSRWWWLTIAPEGRTPNPGNIYHDPIHMRIRAQNWLHLSTSSPTQHTFQMYALSAIRFFAVNSAELGITEHRLGCNLAFQCRGCVVPVLGSIPGRNSNPAPWGIGPLVPPIKVRRQKFNYRWRGFQIRVSSLTPTWLVWKGIPPKKPTLIPMGG